jgi:hypothetical protein
MSEDVFILSCSLLVRKFMVYKGIMTLSSLFPSPQFILVGDLHGLGEENLHLSLWNTYYISLI